MNCLLLIITASKMQSAIFSGYDEIPCMTQMKLETRAFLRESKILTPLHHTTLIITMATTKRRQTKAISWVEHWDKHKTGVHSGKKK
jgi:hypothetical protein